MDDCIYGCVGVCRGRETDPTKPCAYGYQPLPKVEYLGSGQTPSELDADKIIAKLEADNERLRAFIDGLTLTALFADPPEVVLEEIAKQARELLDQCT